MIAESFERIHRSNLVGMGVLPLEFKNGENGETLGLTGKETFHIEGLDDQIQPLDSLVVRAVMEAGNEVKFSVTVRLDTPIEVNYYRNGGILHTVLRNMLQD